MTIKLIGNGSIELGDGLRVTFQRTLRIPEDGQTHSLPPSLGQFPVRRVEDFKGKVPAAWEEHGGVFLPMYQREAMWLQFGSSNGKHFALKVATGKVNALNGKKWSEKLKKAKVESGKDPVQDYSVIPGQPWLDGFNTGDGVIRQFVAMPLGMGYTVEAQVTGKEDVGGLQLLAIPAKEGAIKPPPVSITRGGFAAMGGGYYGATGSLNKSLHVNHPLGVSLSATNTSYGKGMSSGGIVGSAGPNYESAEVYACASMDDSNSRGLESMGSTPTLTGAEMGLAAGGKMKQSIYADPHGIEVWDQEKGVKLFVHIVNSQMWKAITGEEAPSTPVTAKSYAQYRYPWFDLYDEHVPAVQGSGTLANVKPVSQMDKKKKIKGQQDDSKIDSKKNVIKYNVSVPAVKPKTEVTDGKW